MSYSQKNDPIINPSTNSNSLEPKTSPPSSLRSSSSHTPAESTSAEELKPIPDSNDSSIYYVPKKKFDIQSSQLLSSTPFVNSQNHEDDSFNSLQLSGNLISTISVNSNPELVSVLQSPSKLTFPSSSSDEGHGKKLSVVDTEPSKLVFRSSSSEEDHQKKLYLNEKPQIGSSQSEMDIFNPGKEILQESSGNESHEVVKKMEFELSQDFSQFHFDLPESEEPTKASTSTEVPTSSKIEDKLLKPKDTGQIEEFGECSKNERQPSNITDMNGEKCLEKNNKNEDEEEEANQALRNSFNKFLSESGISRDVFSSFFMKNFIKKKEEEEPKREKAIYVGKECFALWEGYFFPANVTKVDNDRVTVLFEDEVSSELSTNDVIFKETFCENQKVHVKMPNGEYRNGHILYTKRVNGEMKYWCLVDKKYTTDVDRYSIRFAREYLMPRKPTSRSNNKTTKSRKRRASVVPSSSSENNNAVDKTKTKKVKPDPCHLFSPLHFLITKGQKREDVDEQKGGEETKTIDTATETEDEISELDEHCAVESITLEGGVYIDKLTSRDLNKAKKIVCITDITKPSTNHYSVKFLYCIACGIPIVHFDWLYHSIEKREILDPLSYVVPAGKDITGEKIEQAITTGREPYTPLNGVTIHVHVGEVWKYSVPEIKMLLQKIGCEIQTTHQVTKKTKRIQFDISTIHYVLTLTNKVPKLLVDTCEIHKKEILTMEWLTQCVINNKLLDVEDSPLFRYNVNSKG